MTIEAVAAGVAVEWLAVSGTFLVAAVDRALARRRADAAVAAAQAWVWVRRELHVEDLGGSLDLAEAEVWWRRMQRANEKERDTSKVLDGLGMGA